MTYQIFLVDSGVATLSQIDGCTFSAPRVFHFPFSLFQFSVLCQCQRFLSRIPPEWQWRQKFRVDGRHWTGSKFMQSKKSAEKIWHM